MLMGVPGIIRKMDALGRVVIPGELRRATGLQQGDDVEIYLEDGALVLRKFSPNCIFCGGRESLVTYEGKYICGACLQNLRKG